MLNQEQMKKIVGEFVLKFIEEDMYVGVGTGSTVGYFITKLAEKRNLIKGAVASSVATYELLKQYKIPVLDLNSVGEVDVYIDGADEINGALEMIKGGGGALTREKILAVSASKFICIADETKYVATLGSYPLPIEVIPMARGLVGRALVKLNASPNWREGFVTDNGNWVLDVYNLDMTDPIKLEEEINNITGVVANGIFARRRADVLLLARNSGVIDTIK